MSYFNRLSTNFDESRLGNYLHLHIGKMTSCLSSKGSDKAAAGGREEGITPGGSIHADQKTGRQGILPPGAPEVA